MISKVLKILVPLVGIVVIVAAGLRSTQQIYRLKRWRSGGELHSSVRFEGDSSLVFLEVDERDFTGPPIPASGDSLITINGDPATFELLVREMNLEPPGKQFEIKYLTGAGDTLTTTAVSTRTPASVFWIVFTLSVLRMIIWIAFAVTGFWAFLKQPASGAVRALALFCFSMAALLVAAFGFGYEHLPIMEIPGMEYLMVFMGMCVGFSGAFWLNLQLLFPTPRGFVQRHPILSHSMIYLPLVILAVLSYILDNETLGAIFGILAILQIFAGFGFLIVRNHRTKDLLEKRQTRLVLWGTGTGIFIFFFVVLLFLVFRNWFIGLGVSVIMGVFIFVFLGLLLSPLSFIYAFGKYRLLEVEGRIKRGTRRIAITAVLVVIFFAILYSISGLILERIGIQSRALVPALALVLAVGLTPAQKRIQSIIERKIYPERTLLREMLRDFLANALAVTDRNTFWDELESRLCNVLNVDTVTTVLNAGDERHMILRDGGEIPFRLEGEFANALLKFEDRPLMVDEILASGAVRFSSGERLWLESNDIAVALPLVSRSKLIGFLAVGMKRTRQDFEAADIEVLRSLSFQVAVAGENLRLLEENIEKQRMENELSMARKVQEGLLPAEMPETPGLEVIGTSLSCLEVAGDYFDVINLDDTRTVLAIGDVSGKGAGAAMLMSNLQASIRTAVRIGSDLKQMIEQINDLIFDNTQAHQFITFFAGIFDSATSQLSYVNAGHNPPLLVKKDGSFISLESGGLILGALADMTYEQESVKLDEGDLLFLYTDGLSEAENTDGEMYDEERVEEFAVRSRDLPLEEIVGSLVDDVDRFMNGALRRDDLTLLIARVKS
jgi:sigma-B regulation protein RsbU (phosphoserine phosphatase)